MSKNNTILTEDYRAMLRDNVSLNVDLQNHIKLQDKLLATRENVIKTQLQEIQNLELELEHVRIASREALDIEWEVTKELIDHNYSLKTMDGFPLSSPCTIEQAKRIEEEQANILIEDLQTVEKFLEGSKLGLGRRHNILLKAITKVVFTALDERADVETIAQNILI